MEEEENRNDKIGNDNDDCNDNVDTYDHNDYDNNSLDK